jgi:hypothetical protein
MKSAEHVPACGVLRRPERSGFVDQGTNLFRGENAIKANVIAT